MFGLETIIEPPGNPLHIESGTGTPGDIYDSQVLLFFQGESDRGELLN